MLKFDITGYDQVGLNSDISPELLPPSGLTTVQNGHIIGNRLYAIGGYAKAASGASEVPTLFDPGHLRFVEAETSPYWVICGSGVENDPSADDKAIYTYDGSTFRNVAGAVAIYDNLQNPNSWTSCLFNNCPVVNHPQSYPLRQATSSASTTFTELYWVGTTKWSTQQVKCGAIASHKNFLFAMDMTEGATEYPYVVRWSDAADPGAMPVWDETDPTNLAGKLALAAEGGRCLNGATLRDSFIVYRENAIHCFDFIGGEFVFNNRVISANIGTVGRHSFCEYNGLQYFISKGDIYVNNGDVVESLLDDKQRLAFLSLVNQNYVYRSFVFALPILNEIWFCVPVGSDYVNYAFVYNIKKNSFTTVTFPETYHASVGHPTTPDDTWSTMSKAWQSTFGTWLVSASGSIIPSVYFCTIEVDTTKSQLLQLNTVGFSTDDPFDAVFERTGLKISDDEGSITLLEAYPHHSAPGDIYFQIGTQDSPFGPVSWHDEEVLSSDQRKIDIRATGKYFAYRFRSADTFAWYLSGLSFKYEIDGER